MHTIAEYSFEVQNRHAHFPHWYLALIGVDPMFQGRHYTSALIKPMLARIDREHLPCFLDIYNEKNKSVFQKYGFKVVKADTIPGCDVDFWAMLREKSG